MLSRFAVAVVLACSTLIPAAAADAGAGIPPLDTTRVASGLTRPIFATYAPDDFTRLFIIEKQGRIKILNTKTGVVQTTAQAFLNIDSLVGGGTSTNDERGLLGLAFHPDYQTNGLFYVNYTNNSSNTTVAQYTRLTPDSANAGSASTILTINQPFTNHNGGWIGFGPNDGYLYISTGDGGSSCDPGQRSQDTTNQKLGKMLRIDVDNGSPYGIPADNPFVGVTGDDEIWAFGLRNAWRPSFDRANGDFYIADVGQFQWEEINYQPASSPGGENYGWDCTEGNACPAPGCAAGACGCADTDLVDPIKVYSHGLGCSITGGYIYRGCDIPGLDGTYFYADYCSNRIWSFTGPDASDNFQERTSELAPGGGLSITSITSFGEDAKGELYICDQNGGEVFKIVPTNPTIKPSDFDCDGDVDTVDLLFLLSSWGNCDGCLQDLDGNHVVGTLELLQLLSEWG